MRLPSASKISEFFWKKFSREFREAVSMEQPQVIRPINDLPVIEEYPDVLLEWYYTSANFMPVQNYPRKTTILNNEIGCVILTVGLDILPILRVLTKRPGGTSGKKGYTEGVDES